MDTNKTIIEQQSDNIISFLHDIMCRKINRDKYEAFLGQVKEDLEEYTKIVLHSENKQNEQI